METTSTVNPIVQFMPLIIICGVFWVVWRSRRRNKINGSQVGLIRNLKGLNGQLEVFQDKVIIRRKGAFSKMCYGFFKGDKTIYIHQIAGIQVKLGGLTNGYIQFTVPGGIESTKGIYDAMRDENSVMFTPGKNKQVEEMKKFIEKMIAEKNQGKQSGVNHPAVSHADELRKFKNLLDEKVISQDEFDRKKKELLGF